MTTKTPVLSCNPSTEYARLDAQGEATLAYVRDTLARALPLELQAQFSNCEAVYDDLSVRLAGNPALRQLLSEFFWLSTTYQAIWLRELPGPVADHEIAIAHHLDNLYKLASEVDGR